MPTTNTPKAEAKGEDKPERSTVAAKGEFDKVLARVKAAGKAGIGLADLAKATGLPYRVVHNITWRMEGSPKDGALRKPEERVIVRVNTDRKVLYAIRPKGTGFSMRGIYATKAQEEAPAK